MKQDMKVSMALIHWAGPQGMLLDRGLGVLVSKDCPVSAAQGPRRFRIRTPGATRPPLARQWEERLSAYNPSTVVMTH